MDRQARVARWIVAMLIVVGMLHGSASALAQDFGTPEATAPPATVISTAEPTLAPTEAPQEPTVAPATAEPPPPTETPAEPTGVADEPTTVPTATVDASPEASSRIQALLAEGTVVVTARNSSDVAVLDVCYTVFVNDGGRQGAFAAEGCDADDALDGVTTIGGLQPGSYLLVGSYVPTGYRVGGEQAITVVSGQTATVTFHLVTGGRTIRIAKVDDGNNPLPGACFNLNEDPGNGEPGDFVAGNCSDPDATDGLVFISGVPPGVYVLVETRAPAGFLAGPDQVFTLPAGFGFYNLTVPNAPVDAPGNLIVNKTDEHNAPLGGACFNVFRDAGGGIPGQFVDGQCDSGFDGQDDGTTVVPGLEPGSYVLVETVAPQGYIVGGSRTFTVTADAPTTLTIQNLPGGATLTIRKVDGAGQPIPGSCFGVERLGSGGPTVVAGECDDNGVSPNDGTLVIAGLAPGNYVLFESETPDGYVTAADVRFTVNAAADDLSLTVTNVAIDSPGNLVITKVDTRGNVLADACFVAFVDAGGGRAGAYASGTCDGDDGRSDGTMVIAGLDPGAYVVRETLAPEGYRFGGEYLVTIPATGSGATLLTVENVVGGTTVIVNMRGENGTLVGGVCFDVHLNDGTGLATDGSFVTSGCTEPSVTFTGFPGGEYILIVSDVPAGYGYPGYVYFAASGDLVDQVINVQLLPETAVEAIVRQLIEILIRILESL